MHFYFLLAESNGGGGITYDPVGFSAHSQVDAYYEEFSPIRFGGVITNIGNRYYVDNSTFVCPYDGVYLFSIAILGDHRYRSDYQLLLDGGLVATVFLDSSSVGTYPTGATVVVIECNAGSSVYVRSGDDAAWMMGGYERHSVFSGYMLYPYL